MSELLQAMSGVLQNANETTQGRAKSAAWTYKRRVNETGSATVDLSLGGEAGAEKAFTDPIQLAAHASKRSIKGKDKMTGETASNEVNFDFALSQLPGELPGENAFQMRQRLATEQSAVETGEVSEAEKLERELTEAG